MRAAKGLGDFLGPVAGAVQDEWSDESRRRAAFEALAHAAAAGVSVVAVLGTSEVLALVVIPTLAAVFGGATASLRRWREGSPRTAAPLEVASPSAVSAVPPPNPWGAAEGPRSIASPVPGGATDAPS